MNPEIKTQWVAALRSGAYQQGRGTLRTADNKYCCLGVLTDLAVQAGIAEWEEGPFDYIARGPNFSYDSESSVPPQSVRKWAGLDMANPQVAYTCHPDGEVPLSYLNDHLRLNFDGIAYIIEGTEWL